MNTYGFDINIKEVLNGYIVTIGCETVVVEGEKSFEDAVNRLTKLLSEFLHDRDAMTTSYLKRFGNDGKRASKGMTGTSTTSTTIYPR